MKRLLFVVLAALLLAHPGKSAAQVQRPRLVVGLVVDQMRWDYLYYYYDQYRTDGLRRLLDQGYSFQNTLINYLPAVTAVGHSSIYTGSVPAFTGIVSNNFYINGRPTYCVSDSTVTPVGTTADEGRMSPRNLLATGIGDMLKMATDGRSKVIGISLKDRAAILPAGFAADGAYWWGKKAGHFVTSSYYRNDLPEWVKRVNREVQVKSGANVFTSVAGVTKTFQLADAAIDNEQLGQDSITDLLTISVSSTDAIGHTYGTRGTENHDVYMELDRQVAAFLKTLDEKVGRGNYLVFLSADHGASHNPNLLKQRRIPAGGLEMWNWVKPVEQKLEARFGFAPVILNVSNNVVFLNHAGAAKAGKSISDIKTEVISNLLDNEHVIAAVDYEHVLTTTLPQPVREMVVNGYCRGRSGDIYFVPKAGWEDVSNAADYRGTTHATWNPYDTHIPFVLYGWHVKHGESTEETHITDIAPTICAMLHIQMPGCCVGKARY